uniref:Ubiquitin carboxyl-terminal hydrolase MINDY n=1 Tax=Pygocentrus nattereri TaxID=42514 RepID=A0AAR2JF91_PYGNA
IPTFFGNEVVLQCLLSGLKKTIACMDEELPRTNLSINNRSDLRRILHLESLYKKNKVRAFLVMKLLISKIIRICLGSPSCLHFLQSEEHPLKSMLEIMVKEQMKKGGDAKRSSPAKESPSPKSSKSVSLCERGIFLPSSSQDSFLASSKAGLGYEKKNSDVDGQGSRTSRMRRGIMAGPITTSSQVCSFPYFTFMSQLIGRFGSESLIPTVQTYGTFNALKEIIFGSPMMCFSEEWKRQSFTFSHVPALRYGIVQKKGGPCGVLAAVQATVLQKLLFERTISDSSSERLRVSDAVRTKCLTEAVAEILWRAGDRKKATVAINSGRSLFTPVGHYRSEGVLETVKKLALIILTGPLRVLCSVQFESGPFGCILFIICAILSRTIPMVRRDMDVPTSTLIGAHGYCTQELVNLLLCGRAVSNVFDDEMKLDSGNGNFTLLKGIKERCNIGLLSLFEHYNICKVGSYLKTPRFPLWVVCSESHFSVLFSLYEDLASSPWSPREFDLYYYDGLANQQEPIRLTVCEFGLL